MALEVNRGRASKAKGERMAKECISPKTAKGDPYVCVFCLNGADEELCGKMFTKGKIAVHYFCMLFASGLSQNGESENQGILGFLQPDIEKEVKRGYRLKCSYCRQPGATIGCVVRNCKKMFHLGCGRREGSMHQFFGTFCSYCPAHRIEQDVPSTDDPNIVCSICMNIVTASPSDDTLRAPCCSKYWYHRDCVQAYSMSAGLHFFKCPLCNNKDEFQQEMLTMGIYIPDQDASWEKEPNAFQELLERYGNCDAPKCKSDKGRTYNKEDTKWEIILCDFCGSHGSHKACNHLIKHGKRKMCQDCKEVDDKTKYEMDEMYTGCHLSPSPSKRNSLEALQLQLNSPNSSKASSLYPGPSSAMKKKGLPQAGNMEGKCRKYQRKRAMEENASSSKKAKKRKTATCLYNDMSFSDQDDEPLATLRQPIPASENKVRHYTKKSDTKDLPVSGPRSILRDWLTTQNSGSSSKVKKQSTGVRVSPRKKKPFLMEYEGKELLIKSPRVVLKRKLVYPRDGNSLQPRNLVIDMSDGKLCSDWNKEMEVLTNIDTDKRVTRNMIDLDAAKTVFDQAKESNGKLYLNNVSPKKQYLPLFPNLEPSGSMAFDTQSKTTETKQPMDGQSQVKISSSSKQGRKRRSELTKIRRKTEQLEKRRATIGGKDATIGESLFDRKEELHADTEYEVTDTKGKIKLKRKTLPYVKTNHKIDGTSSTVKNEPSTTETVNSSPGNSPYVKPGSSGVTKPDTAVKIKKENISSLKEDSPIFSQKKNHVSSLNKDSPIFPKAKKQISVTSPLRGNTVKKNKKKSLKKSLLCDSPSFQPKKIKGSSSKKMKQQSLDGFISRSSVSPEVPTTSGESKAKTGYTSSAKISKDIPSTEIVNCPEKSKSLPMTPINKRSTAGKKGSLLESELNDSPAKNLRCRNLAFTETECLDYTEGNTEDTDESNNTQTHPTSIDADTNTLSRETLGILKSTSTNSNTKLIDNKSNTRSNVTEVNTRCRVADNSELSTDTDNLICDINSNTKTANPHNHSKSIDINTKSPDVSSFIDRLKKKCLGLDQYNPFKANCESDTCTADDETDSADEDELTTTTKNGFQSGEKPQSESEVCWHLDGTRQISVGPIIGTSEQKRRPKSLQLNSQSNLLSTPPRFSPRKKTESSDSPVVNNLSDLQNVIPSFDNDSEEDLCDTANSLSPSYFTKFRNALSRSGSFDSTITNSLVNVKDIPLPNTEPSATAVTYSNFVASRYNILEPKPYNIFVKRRSSPRKFNDKTPNKKLDYTSSRQSQRKTVEKFDEITNDQSIMSEYYK